MECCDVSEQRNYTPATATRGYAGVYVVRTRTMSKYAKAVVEEALSEALQKLGYASFRSMHQRKAIESFVQGNDVFVCLPTGSGKSLCYCILPAVFDHLHGVRSSIAVVISPLVALMKDQVRAMTEKGVSAVFVGDCRDDNDIARVSEGAYQIVYMSPEALLEDDQWRDMLLTSVYKQNLIGLVVDEAHCVKKW